jgi:glycerol uptake operon antiterminator
MDQQFFDKMTANPVIAAVKDEAGLSECLQCEEIQAVFVLFGDLCNIGNLTARIKAAGKLAIVHADLISGLANKEIAVDFLHQYTQADGIISTRQPFIRRARELHLHTVLRVFVLDSMALANLARMESVHPDFLEILPGTMPKTIRKVCALAGAPVLAGGLISDKEDVMAALEAGAAAISTTNPAVWRV